MKIKYEVRRTKEDGRGKNPFFRPSSFFLHPSSFGRRPAFTLTELLIVIAIIAILSGLGLSAYSGATQMAREMRTRSQITKIDQLIMERYESYRTRSVPIKINAGTVPRIAAMMRLNAIRDLMRMELPDRKADVVDPPCDLDPTPNTISFMTSSSLRNTYLRQATRNVGGAANWPAGWSEGHQGAECLYLILSTMRDGDKSALDFFQADEIGDVDGDGMKEILDGWGNPIEFLRWPAGYAEQKGPDGQWGVAGVDDDNNNVVDDVTEAGWPNSDDNQPDSMLIGSVLTMQTKNYRKAPDPFDPVKVHAGAPFPVTMFGTAYTPGYLLHPLIYSAGRDKEFDIVSDNAPAIGYFHYSAGNSVGLAVDQNAPNPYVNVTAVIAGKTVSVAIGTVGDVNGDGEINYADNITNHDLKNQ